MQLFGQAGPGGFVLHRAIIVFLVVSTPEGSRILPQLRGKISRHCVTAATFPECVQILQEPLPGVSKSLYRNSWICRLGSIAELTARVHEADEDIMAVHGCRGRRPSKNPSPFHIAETGIARIRQGHARASLAGAPFFTACIEAESSPAEHSMGKKTAPAACASIAACRAPCVISNRAAQNYEKMIKITRIQ
jgi:hypothetical protein